jgi:hypothetical protein
MDTGAKAWKAGSVSSCKILLSVPNHVDTCFEKRNVLQRVFVFVFETGSVQAGFELEILLPLPPKCWDYNCAPLHLASPKNVSGTESHHIVQMSRIQLRVRRHGSNGKVPPRKHEAKFKPQYQKEKKKERERESECERARKC